MPRDVLLAKVAETAALGGDQILMQGGLHPDFTLEWYEQLLRDITSRFPNINVHGFSPPELHHFTKVNRLPIRTVLIAGAEQIARPFRHVAHERCL